MNDSLDQIFGLTTFRPNIYNDLMQSWCYHGDRFPCHIANGYTYMHSFAPFYSDYNAACAAIVASDSSAFAAFPHLQLAYRSGTRMAPPAVSQTAAGERSRLLLEAVRIMNDFSKTETIDDATVVPQNLRMYAPAQYMNGNLSQYHRNMQERVVGEIRKPMHNVMAWLLNHLEKEEGVFSLRPFHNMPGPYQETLRSADPLSGLHAPSMYWTASQQVASEALDSWGIFKYIQRVLRVEPDESDAAWNLREWQYWNDRAAYAVIRYPSGSEVALGPSAMIPPLLSTPREGLPMFWATPSNVGLLYENVYWTQYLDQDDIIDEQDFTNYPTFYDSIQPSENQFLAKAMAAAVFFATLVVAQTKMGRGHHKPYWTATPLNMPVCEYWLNQIRWMESKVIHGTV